MPQQYPEIRAEGSEITYLETRSHRPFDYLDGKQAHGLVTRFHRERQPLSPENGSPFVYDLIPEKSTGNPIVFLSGYYAEGMSLRQMMYDTYLAGRRSLTMSGYHGMDITPEFRERYAKQIADLQNADNGSSIEPQLRKAAALITMLDQKGLRGVDVFAQSEGAIVAAIANYLRPDLFATKALLNPAGLIGEVSQTTIMQRKVLDDADVVRRRVENAIADIRGTVEVGCRALLGNIFTRDHNPVLPPHSTQWRQIDRHYANNPTEREDLMYQDLNPIQRVEAGRGWGSWARTQVGHATGVLGPGYYRREYYRESDPERLKAELTSLVQRRMENWLRMQDTSSFVIGTSDRDRLYPSRDVMAHAHEAGVNQFIILNEATHNVQHFQPDKVTQFIFQALKIQSPIERQAA